MKPSRTLRWISSVAPENEALLRDLQERMMRFYRDSASYYGDIEYASLSWRDDPCYRDIAARLQARAAILEVGCGAANILEYHRKLEARYTGCDFSPDLIRRNRERHSAARFEAITDPRRFPVPDRSADAVFSLWVIEHTIYPADFLSECVRVLKPGGLFVLRAPDFLGASRMTSQRAGFGFGTGRDKLTKGKVIDALVTGFDRKVAIPRRCEQLRKKIGEGFGFYVNLAPTCFEDPFAPDHDAIYLTYAEEMVNFLRGKIDFDESWRAVNRQWPIYLVGVRK
jgi:SAM-dependent methyltransferase